MLDLGMSDKRFSAFAGRRSHSLSAGMLYSSQPGMALTRNVETRLLNDLNSI